MATPSEYATDILIFISGFVLLIIALVFLQLFFRYRKRDYLLLFFGFIAAAVSAILGDLDDIVGESITTEVLEFLSALFTFIMVTMIVLVIFFPHRVPVDFEEKMASGE